MNRITLTTIIFLIIAGMLTGCATEVDAAKRAEATAQKLMKRFNLHPAGAPVIREFPVVDRSKPSEHVFVPINHASKEIGIDINKHLDKNLRMLSYLLKERSQSHEQDIHAYFVFDDEGRVVGAYLILAGFMPGAVSLKDRSAFYPEGLKPDHIALEGIDRIDIYGSFGSPVWESSATISQPEEIKDFVSAFAKARPKRGHFNGAYYVFNHFLIAFSYKDGPVVRARVVSRQSGDIMGIDTFPEWHYKPSKELMARITKLLQESDERRRSQPAPPETDDMKGAREALVSFFSSLHDGHYDQAVRHYGGSYKMLREWNPDIDKNNRALLFKRGCERNGLYCLKIGNILHKEQHTPTGFSFVVQFLNDDGTIFARELPPDIADGEHMLESKFWYNVTKTNGTFLVQELPVYTP